MIFPFQCDMITERDLPLDYTEEKKKEGFTMKLFDFLESSDINRDVEQYRQTEGALLLDVRGVDEYAEGHIPGSMNIPLQLLPMKKGLPEDLDTPIFVYCRSGGRSRRAAAFLEKEGYENVKNIGGIMNWKGEIEV